MIGVFQLSSGWIIINVYINDEGDTKQSEQVLLRPKNRVARLDARLCHSLGVARFVLCQLATANEQNLVVAMFTKNCKRLSNV